MADFWCRQVCFHLRLSDTKIFSWAPHVFLPRCTLYLIQMWSVQNSRAFTLCPAQRHRNPFWWQRNFIILIHCLHLYLMIKGLRFHWVITQNYDDILRTEMIYSVKWKCNQSEIISFHVWLNGNDDDWCIKCKLVKMDINKQIIIIIELILLSVLPITMIVIIII